MKGKHHRKSSKNRSFSRDSRKNKHKRRSRDSSPHYSSYHSQSYSRKSSISHSSSRSKSRKKRTYSSESSSSSHSNHKRREFAKKKSSAPKKKQEKKQENSMNTMKNRPRINPFMLSGIILDHKKTNGKLDEEEVGRANKQFKEFDKSERQATLLSSYINKTDEMINKEEYYMDFVNGEYIKIMKPYICDFNQCGQRFRFHGELNEHMEKHLKEKGSSFNKKKNEFVQNNIYYN